MNYLEMVNEVLVRMREDEITSVKDSDNDAQQKLVCKFVRDAVEFVMGSHTWNAQRRVWSVPLIANKHNYTLPTSGQGAAIYTVRFAETESLLTEANARYLSTKKEIRGKPAMYTTAHADAGNMSINLHPTPDDRYPVTGADPSEYGIAEYAIAEYSGTGRGSDTQELAVFGYAQAAKLVGDSDNIELPHMPVMYYAMAYASRERGELGGQSTAELFALAASYMSDAISWDVNSTHLEYIWNPV